MASETDRRSSSWTEGPVVFGGEEVPPGEHRDIQLPVSESYSGFAVNVPLRVLRGARAGPALFVSAAVHGDEINGTGVVRALLAEELELLRGTLVLVPVVNILGFERHTRYLPDRRDLNRVFPGTATGSLASRFAHRIFSEIVAHCEYGIDLHTGAVRRTNFPNLRGDLENEGVLRLARAFGCELVVQSKGPKGSLRGAACDAGCPTIVMEAGEVWKIEPSYVEVGLRGVRNVLADLGMIDEPVRPAPYRTRVDSTTWVRANSGGLLNFHVSPGSLVERDQPLATCGDLLGSRAEPIRAPKDGIVMGMTTLPTVKPGDPVCHLAIPTMSLETIRRQLERIERIPGETLEERVRDDLASNVTVEEADEEGFDEPRGSNGE